VHAWDVGTACVEHGEYLARGDIGACLCAAIADHAIDVGIRDIAPIGLLQLHLLGDLIKA